jgi:hypothetical protein
VSAASAATYRYVGNAANNEIVVLSLDTTNGDLRDCHAAITGIRITTGLPPGSEVPYRRLG